MKTLRSLVMLFIVCLAVLGAASPFYASAAATTTHTYYANASQGFTDILVFRAPAAPWRWAKDGPLPPPPTPW